MTYGSEDDRRNPEPWKTNYVRESYAREKHPDDEEIIQMRRVDFDNWLERHDASMKQGEPSDAQVHAAAIALTGSSAILFAELDTETQDRYLEDAHAALIAAGGVR